MTSFTTSFAVPQPPEQVFEAVRDPRAWWSAAIKGRTFKIGDVFRYEVPDMHRCTFRVTEVVPPKRLSWLLLDSWLTITDVKDEWTGTTASFEISEHDDLTHVRFTHNGLTPEFECFDLCSNAWTGYITGSLRYLITTGTGQPNPAVSPAR